MTLKDRIIKILTDMAYVLPKVPYQTPFVDQVAEVEEAEVEKQDTHCDNNLRIARADGDPNGNHMPTSLVVEHTKNDMAAVYVSEKPTGFEEVRCLEHEDCTDCCVGNRRDLTQDEINQKFGELLREICNPCDMQYTCVKEYCRWWKFVSIDGNPIRKAKG